MTNCAIHVRLEPRRPLGNLDRGFRAEVADPLWLLGRQWQLGEHQGEDASSPVLVDVEALHTPVDPLPAHPDQDPTLVPLEGVVEREAEDWWTSGRRVRLGREYAVANNLDAAPPPDRALADLPAPYDSLNGRGYDGRLLWRQDPGDPVFAAVPAAPAEAWDPAELVYSTLFTAANTTLELTRHDGGRLDWYSVDADVALQGGAPDDFTVLPNRMSYPGAPHPRWWQIEDHQVDVGGFPPDRGHFATMLLLELVVSHADDWFTFPVDGLSGSVVRLDTVRVHDSFDESWDVVPPVGWEMFRVRGLSSTSLLLWPTVATPLRGAVLEEVVLGVDEDANVLWAVELRAAGRDLPTETFAPGPAPADAPGEVDASARVSYEYRPATGARRYWHPYVREVVNGRRRFVQGRLADYATDPPTMMPEPVAEVLYDVANLAPDPANQAGPVHQIEPSTVPRYGMRLNRQAMLARDVTGNPVLWVQRRRLPLHAPPSTALRFDVLLPE